ncbi:SLC13 family permease [Lactobacillus sp. ESL0731]|uniref:SLC13 family permease n=1 Tax=unclassified Lactobacillus TaxID=2620435 RepID=UPI0023F9A6BF|nr:MULTISPECIES: SLC13 family permease [unclassified Lactobacillus]WEV51096.1 SLC13 family permease [Lactobacillus sp. ESL0700]WEV62225.1 SLC13 family permease [Lactobacillus sp. ESL0731]
MNAMMITVLILLAVIIAFVSGKVPISLIGVAVMFALVIFNILPVEKAFGGITNTSVILFAAMFVIGKGIQKTTIVSGAASLVKRFKNKPKLLTFFTCIIAALLAIVSNGTIALVIMLPILCGICDDIGMSKSKLLYPFQVVAVSAAGAWFLGIGALNMSWSNVMIKLGAHTAININDFLISRIPFLIVIILYMTFFSSKLLPNISNKDLAAESSKDTANSNKNKLSKVQNAIAIFIISVTIILMILSSYLKLQSYIIAIAGALMLVITGVLSNKEALGALNINIILLIASMLGLADALQASGAGNLIGTAMANIAKNISNPFLMMGLFFTVSFIIANLLGGLAAISILVPLWTLTCLKLGLDPRGAVLAASTASAFNFLTPVGCHSLPLIMGIGGYTLKDFFKCGGPLAIILCILSSFVMQVMYPL